MNYTESHLEALAQSDPDALVALIDSGQLDAVDLTWAGEYLGLYAPSEKAVPALLRLLDHPRALVREGALYGLNAHHGHAGVMDAVRRHTDPALEPSEAVREAAGDVVEYINAQKVPY